MSHAIDKARVRAELKPRREPYWGAPIARGRYLGLRKISLTTSSWIARYRGEDDRQRYSSLGYLSKDFDIDKAKVAAAEWFKRQESDVRTNKAGTVADAYRQYIENRAKVKSKACATDAQWRFNGYLKGHSLGKVRLTKLRATHVREWRDELKIGKSSANRMLTSLKAALNLAVDHEQAPASVAVECRKVKRFEKADKRRELFLDLNQRRALLSHCSGALRDLVEAAMLTGARAGELVSAERGQLDARRSQLKLKGKTGDRTVPLSPPAVALFTRLAEGKGAADLLLVRDTGAPWKWGRWAKPIREAAKVAELPDGTCLYTLRHSWISQMIADGMTTLDVAKLCGTSLLMIEKNYGKASKDISQRLANVVML